MSIVSDPTQRIMGADPTGQIVMGKGGDVAAGVALCGDQSQGIVLR